MSTPIWVTDPNGNDNPYLEVLNGGNFVVGSVGQQLGAGDYYTSSNGTSWTANIGGLSVVGANNGDGVAQAFTSDRKNFLIVFSGSGSYGGGATQKTQMLISHNSANTFSLSSMSGFGDGANSPVLGTLFNFYDAFPISGSRAFRLAIENQALTQVTYQSSYDGGQTWTVDKTAAPPQHTSDAPAFWGKRATQNYVKGMYNGAAFYVMRISVLGNVGIYGGTTAPVPPFTSVPSGWSLLFTPTNGSGFSDATFQMGATNGTNTTFVINDSLKAAPMIAVGTGNPSSWQEITLSGSLGVTSGISGDLSTWVYT